MSEQQDNGTESGESPSRSWTRIAIGGALTAFAAALGARAANSLDTTGIEQLSNLAACVAGVAFMVQFCLRVYGRYLRWIGERRKGWGHRERRRLFRLTVLSGMLAASLLASGVFFHQQPADAIQLGVYVVLVVATLFTSNRIKRLIVPNGPPPLSVEIQRCGLVTDVIGKAFPPSLSGALAVAMVACLCFTICTQALAVGIRLVGHRPSKASSSSVRPKPADRRLSEVGPQTNSTDPAPETNADQGQAPVPSLAQLCGPKLAVFDLVAPPYRSQMRETWEELNPFDACPHQVKKQGDTYLIEGKCGAETRSLGLVSLEHEAEIALEDAASQAERLSLHVALLGASRRVDLGEGDFQVLFSRLGPYLLMREHKTDGNGGTQGTARSCADIVPGGEKYVVLPPGMAELLLRFEQQVTPSWPSQDTSESNPSIEYFTLHRDGVTVAHAWCTSPTDCALRGQGLELTSSREGASTVRAQEIYAYGPHS